MDVLVFRTDLDSRKMVTVAQTALTKLAGIRRATVDMEDCDNVLRIESIGVDPDFISQYLSQLNIYCEELDY